MSLTVSLDDIVIAVGGVAVLSYAAGFWIGDRSGEGIGRILGRSDATIERLRQDLKDRGDM